MSGTITETDKGFVETWENISRASNVIIRLDPRGDETTVVISGPRQFHVTTQERVIMQARVLDPANDPYRNGAFRPILVPDSVTASTNPNALSDDEIRSILVSSDVAWAEWLAVLDSPETLQRMMDLANETPSMTMVRYRELGARLVAVKPRTRIVSKDREQLEALAPTPPPAGELTGRTGARGRSRDYR